MLSTRHERFRRPCVGTQVAVITVRSSSRFSRHFMEVIQLAWLQTQIRKLECLWWREARKTRQHMRRLHSHQQVEIATEVVRLVDVVQLVELARPWSDWTLHSQVKLHSNMLVLALHLKGLVCSSNSQLQINSWCHVSSHVRAKVAIWLQSQLKDKWRNRLVSGASNAVKLRECGAIRIKRRN